ncbi:MAG: hypothetical protein KKF46_06420 [Nanoarchaeota archaeon]|nr:hypothetical protein [Nanoarchaeota archaeon]MBU1321963.1 hypothetical protein [Nanoarchaeota archaeon]MBU1597459.1 hypothetical protein [Nanoarchaeota archaeon]MBU2442378.1 hypothetical protein [Nanoarchaeota archaeon]
MNPEEMGRLLVKHGFIKGNSQKKYKFSDEKGSFIAKEGETSHKDADMEYDEEANIEASVAADFTNYLPTGYPTPARRYRVVLEASKLNMEETYYWILNFMRQDAAFPYVDKITDVFSASEQSAMWGAAQTRMGMQQDRASQNLRSISDMVKQLFQVVRELRILDEKLEPRKKWKESKAADVALKAEYADLVERVGGQMQPGGVFQLAQQVGYTALPDLFFNTHIYRLEDIDKVIDDMKYNKNLRQVLRRKLFAFLNWKLKTDKELKTRRVFLLKYLRQHWNIIKTLMNWAKPYLRNIARMQMSPEHMDSPDIVGAFETSMMEIELLAYKKPNKGDYHPCVLTTFKYRTRPELSFQQDNYAHRGPIHVGKVEVTFRAYGWTKKQMDAYRKYKRDEDMLLLGLVDSSVQNAMDALGEELETYLWEAGEKEFEEKRKAKEFAEKKKEKAFEKQMAVGMIDPFISIFKGFWEIFSLFAPSGIFQKSSAGKISGSSSDAANAASGAMFNAYKYYKKAHGMLSW